MKITNRQKEEINFMENFGINESSFISTPQEQKEYIEHTVYGKKENKNNRLFQAKRNFDITYKMWREDLIGKMSNGFPLISKNELLESFNYHPYLKRILNEN